MRLLKRHYLLISKDLNLNIFNQPSSFSLSRLVLSGGCEPVVTCSPDVAAAPACESSSTERVTGSGLCARNWPISPSCRRVAWTNISEHILFLKVFRLRLTLMCCPIVHTPLSYSRTKVTKKTHVLIRISTTCSSLFSGSFDTEVNTKITSSSIYYWFWMAVMLKECILFQSMLIVRHRFALPQKQY